MNISFQLPKWADLHAHLRQDTLLPYVVNDHLKSGCASIVAMPNTQPPIGKVLEQDKLPFWSIENYLNTIRSTAQNRFEHIIVPLYLTGKTTSEMIEAGTRSGFLKACKYYPPHGTTNANFSVPLNHLVKNGVLKAMENNGIILCVHGEQHALTAQDYFDQHRNAEILFYQNTLPKIRENFPRLKIVCEHITTETAVDFVNQSGAHTAATVTPQHLLYTVGDLLQGCKYHLYCLPLLKFEQDRKALRAAVTHKQNKQFFAGTDSAPHTQKCTPCGCAAGCYTAAIGPQLYAQAFEESGCELSKPENQKIFEAFLSRLGPEFYNLPVSLKTFTLEKKLQVIEKIQVNEHFLIPLPVGLTNTLESTSIDWQIKLYD